MMFPRNAKDQPVTYEGDRSKEDIHKFIRGEPTTYAVGFIAQRTYAFSPPDEQHMAGEDMMDEDVFEGGENEYIDEDEEFFDEDIEGDEDEGDYEDGEDEYDEEEYDDELLDEAIEEADEGHEDL